jgi:lipoprotein NlpI
MRIRAWLMVWVLIPAAVWAQSTPGVNLCASPAGTVDERLAACTRAITSKQLSNENLAITYSNRGNAWTAKGEYDRAIADYTEAIRLNPQFAAAHTNRCIAWDAKGDNERAIADCSEAIRLNPQYADGYFNRGVAWSAKGEYDRAIADYSEAIRLDPTGALRYMDRGVAEFLSDRLDAAAEDFAAAGRMRGDLAGYAVIWCYLARARGGHVDLAASELQAAYAALDKKEWPAPFVELMLGRGDASAVLKSVKDPCDGNFYVGEYYLSRNRPAEALPLLRNAQRDCGKDLAEYDAAVAELKRLEGAP